MRTLVIRIANNPDRFGPSSKHFFTIYCISLWFKSHPNCQIHTRKYVLNVLFVGNICSLKQPFLEFFSTSYCHCWLFAKKNPLIRNFYISGWLAVPNNPDKCSSTVILIFMASGYMCYDTEITEL